MNPHIENDRILIAVLNWGLGHATRCTPLIQACLSTGFPVHLASDGKAYDYLKLTFPDLPIHLLPSYEVSYGKKRMGLLNTIQLAWNSFRVVNKERRALEKIIRENQIRMVFSDNRLGLHSNLVNCYYITHQLRINAGIFSTIATKIHRHYYSKYRAVIVPDTPEHLFSGDLSRPVSQEDKIFFCGPLSRLYPLEEKEITNETDLLIILSGPEPLRTTFENQILSAATSFQGNITLLRGLVNTPIEVPRNVRVFNHLSGIELSREIQAAKVVLSRAGYSTIMDLAQFGSKSILIPTPGQGEQEYLAHYFYEKGMAVVCTEETLDLNLHFHEALNLNEGIPKIKTALEDYLTFFKVKEKVEPTPSEDRT